MPLHDGSYPHLHPYQKGHPSKDRKTNESKANQQTSAKNPAKGGKGGKSKSNKTNAPNRNGKPTHVNKAEAVQATDLPAPIPQGVSSPPPAHSVQIIVPPVPSSLLPTPTVPTTIAYGLTSTVWVYTTNTASTSVPDSSKVSSVSASSKNHLSTFIIVLIAIGSACALVAMILVAKFCFLRKLRRTRPPTPSAPILQESPLFGGKDRFARISDISFGNLGTTPSAKAGLGLGKGEGWKPLPGGNEKMVEKPIIVAPKFPQTALSPASMYPQTPATPAERIAIALEHSPSPKHVMPPPNLPLPQANAYSRKPVDDRRLSRHSIASSLYGGMEVQSPVPSLPYLLPRAVTSTPSHSQLTKPSDSQLHSRPSRERVQAPYANRKSTAAVPSGSASSLSKAPNSYRLAAHESTAADSEIQYTIPTVKSMERKERDTRALTSALGLATPTAQPVSCFSPASVYPEDSVSRRETRRTSYIGSTVGYGADATGSVPMDKGGMHAALGSLMLQEFAIPSVDTIASANAPPVPVRKPTQALDVKKKQLPQKPSTSAPSTSRVPIPASSSRTAVTKAGNSGVRSVGGPPRVPSPPTLPSLAQMAMQNSNPDYHSPTYSIYGMYSERKSGVAASGVGAGAGM